ncbi:MAG: hypothetical protein MJ245_02740 [Clostridia bacterium]|nr:hypothetical protein [Clostridia bacterium]
METIKIIEVKGHEAEGKINEYTKAGYKFRSMSFHVSGTPRLLLAFEDEKGEKSNKTYKILEVKRSDAENKINEYIKNGYEFCDMSYHVNGTNRILLLFCK